MCTIKWTERFSCEPAPCGFRRFNAATGQLADVWVGLNACFTFHPGGKPHLCAGIQSDCVTVLDHSDYSGHEAGLGHPDRRRQTAVWLRVEESLRHLSVCASSLAHG